MNINVLTLTSFCMFFPKTGNYHDWWPLTKHGDHVITMLLYIYCLHCIYWLKNPLKYLFHSHYNVFQESFYPEKLFKWYTMYIYIYAYILKVRFAQGVMQAKTRRPLYICMYVCTCIYLPSLLLACEFLWKIKVEKCVNASHSHWDLVFCAYLLFCGVFLAGKN